MSRSLHNFFKIFGGTVNGDTSLLCDSDNLRLRVRQKTPVSPLLPHIRFHVWVFSPVNQSIRSLD